MCRFTRLCLLFSKAFNITDKLSLLYFRTFEMSFLNAVMKAKEVAYQGKGLYETLMNLLPTIFYYGKSIPYMGSFLAVLQGMLPGKGSEIVGLPRLLQNQNDQLHAVRLHIQKLENIIKLECVKLPYGDIVAKIETGMKFVWKIKKSTNDGERTRFEDRLKELCSNQSMTLAVTTLVKVLAPEDSLQYDILESIYPFTKGHRGEFDSICGRFLLLFVGGQAVILHYEKLVRGEEAVAEMKKTLFEGDAEKLIKRFEAFRQRYTDCFTENMLTDLKEVINGDKSNKDAVKYLSELVREKYDWQETYCIICNKSPSIDYDFSGDHVKILQHNNRFGVIFYREGLECPVQRMLPVLISRQDSTLYKVRQIIRETDKECSFSDAASINAVLRANLRRNGISLWGCATVKVNRSISIPMINIHASITSHDALDSFEISGDWPKAVSDVGDHKHLCLLK